MAADPQTRPTDLGCESACRLLYGLHASSPFKYYSADDDNIVLVSNIESGCPDDAVGSTRYVTTEGSGLERFIATPNYPEKYFRNAKCRWRLAAQRSQTIRLTLVDFELDVRRDGVCHDELRIIVVAAGDDHVIFSDCGAHGKQVSYIISRCIMNVIRVESLWDQSLHKLNMLTVIITIYRPIIIIT